MKRLVPCLIALAALAGCGTAPVAPAARPDAATMAAQSRGKLVLKSMNVGVGAGMPGERPEVLGAVFEVERFPFNQRPSSASIDVRVDGKPVADGLVYPGADGKLYLGHYNGDKAGDYAVLGTYEAKDPAHMAFDTKLKVKLAMDLDWFYKHEGGIMGHSTFYLIAKQAPPMVHMVVPFVKMAPKAKAE